MSHLVFFQIHLTLHGEGYSTPDFAPMGSRHVPQAISHLVFFQMHLTLLAEGLSCIHQQLFGPECDLPLCITLTYIIDYNTYNM